MLWTSYVVVLLLGFVFTRPRVQLVGFFCVGYLLRRCRSRIYAMVKPVPEAATPEKWDHGGGTSTRPMMRAPTPRH